MSLSAKDRLIELSFDPETRSHFVALPSCISRDDAKAFHAFVGEDKFELLEKPEEWLLENDLIKVEGITLGTQVIKLVQDLYDTVKSIFTTWWKILREGREQLRAMQS